MVNFKSSEASGETIQELKRLIDDLWQLRQDKDALASLVKAKNAEIERSHVQLIDIMDRNDLANFEGTHCKIYQTTRTSARFPQEAAAKKEVFDWIKETYGNDTLHGMVSINSMKFNAFYKSAAEDSLDFSMPGVEPPKESVTLGVRKK